MSMTLAMAGSTTVVLEKLLAPAPGYVCVPTLHGGQTRLPARGCRGRVGYESFLEAINDLNNPEHDTMLEWVGGEFDPAAFDLEEAYAACGRFARATGEGKAQA